MTTVVTAANQAGVSLFNSIASVADSVGKIVTTTTSVVDMADAFVSKELTKQKLHHKLDLLSFKKTVAEEYKVSTAEKLAILTQKLTNPDIKVHYSKLDAEFDAILSEA